MVKDLMLHGSVGPVDFFVSIAGANINNIYFYREEESQIRFFSRGNELALSENAVSYKGTGGTFCEYMFGVEKPLKDLVKKEVRNRLVMFGAFLDPYENLIFSNDVEGSESFHRLFILGHAVKNYYFFVSSDTKQEIRTRQKQLLQVIGKLLKRTDLLMEDRDEELLHQVVATLDEPEATVFIFKLIHRGNRDFYESFRASYGRDRMLTADDEARMFRIAAGHRIDIYQQERMKIDVMYRHPDNKGIIDEYRDILLSMAHREQYDQSELARLHRLRSLSIRNSIPAILFDTLEDFLIKDKHRLASEEPDYLKEARAIVETLFFKDSSLKRHIINEDIVRLIKAKHRASLENDMGFEKILLDTGKACDEYTVESNDFSIFEEFSSLVTYFDRYDGVRTSLSRLAFMDSMEITEDLLRSLIGNKKIFDALDGGVFNEIFFRDLLLNKYLNTSGKKRIKTLSRGIDDVIRGDASLKDVIAAMQKVAEEEKLYKQIRSALKGKMRDFYSPLDIREGLGRIRSEMKAELAGSGISDDVPDALFDRVLLDLKTESYYLNHLLPQIIQTGNLHLREDFFANSGLDRFYVESLEKEHLGEQGFNLILEGREFADIGGGERI